MANRSFQQFSLGLEKLPVTLFAKVAIGATGAPTLSVANSKGIASIARNGVGKYTITLQDAYVKLLGVDNIVQNAAGIPAAPTLGILSAGTNVSTVGGGTIVIQFSSGGSATELTTGDTVYLQLQMGNSTAQ
jgi:hypothetical protein